MPTKFIGVKSGCPCGGFLIAMRVNSRCWYMRCMKCGKEGSTRTSASKAIEAWNREGPNSDDELVPTPTKGESE